MKLSNLGPQLALGWVTTDQCCGSKYIEFGSGSSLLSLSHLCDLLLLLPVCQICEMAVS